MKKYMLVFCSILFSVLILAVSPKNVSTELRDDVNLKFFNNSRVILETGFGSGVINNPEAFEELIGKDILKVNLIYTTYREADDFDQIDLNEVRWESLYRLYPELAGLDKVKLVQIGTEKCKSRDCATHQLHGFIIEYKKELFGYRNLEIQEKRANSKSEISMTGKSGTKIYVPADAFVDLDGNEISGTVSLQLREALTAEDIVSANLLTITDKNEALESGGMVQLMAYNNGKQLKLRDGKTADVSIPKTKDNDGMKVWKGEWVDGQLKWNEPEELSSMPVEEAVVSESEVEEISVYSFNKKIIGVHVVGWQTNNDTLTNIDIYIEDDTLKYENDTYAVEVAIADGLSEYQSKRIRNWFAMNAVKDVNDRFWATSRWVPSGMTYDGGSDTWMLNGTGQSFVVDTTYAKKLAQISKVNEAFDEATNAFQMSSLGWANIDRFVKIDERRKTNLEVICENAEEVETLKVTLMIPGWNVFLPGHRLESGNYCFAFDNCASKYSLPKGEKAFVILNGVKDKKTYSSIEEIKLGDTNVLETKLVEKDKKTTLKEIKKLI